MLAWVLASVPRGTDVGVRFLPRPAVKDALFGQTETIFLDWGLQLSRLQWGLWMASGFSCSLVEEICNIFFWLIGRVQLGFWFDFGTALGRPVVSR